MGAGLAGPAEPAGTSVSKPLRKWSIYFLCLFFNVVDLGCDFYPITGHKLYGPSGSGAIYVKKERQAEMRPFLGGGDMIEEVTRETVTYAAPPLRFEAGTPGIAQTIGFAVALDYLMDLGMDNVAAHEARGEKSPVDADLSTPFEKGDQRVQIPGKISARSNEGYRMSGTQESGRCWEGPELRSRTVLTCVVTLLVRFWRCFQNFGCVICSAKPPSERGQIDHPATL